MQQLIKSFGCALLAALGAILVHATDAMAQNWPAKPILIVYPFEGGSPAQAIIRTASDEVSKGLGQNILVEARPGGSGWPGFNAVKNSRPDGYTLAFISTGMLVITPIIDPKFTVTPDKDYVPLSRIAATYFVMSTHPDAPFKDLHGLIAYAKANPGVINASGSSPGSTNDLSLRLLERVAGIKFNLIPYKGEAGVATALLGHHIDVGSTSAVVKPHLDAGKFIGIAVTSPTRMESLPNVPSFQELGLKDFQASTSMGLVGPPDLPPQIASALSAAYSRAVALSEVQGKIKGLGWVPVGSTGTDFGAFVKSQTAVWTPVIREAGIKLD